MTCAESSVLYCAVDISPGQNGCTWKKTLGVALTPSGVKHLASRLNKNKQATHLFGSWIWAQNCWFQMPALPISQS